LVTRDTDLGRVEVSALAVAAIASEAALGCYGVVGLTSRNFRDGLVDLLAPSVSHRGVDVQLNEGQLSVDLYVILEYGVRISEVARNIMAVAKFRIEKALGLPVAQVNVHVHALRVSPEDRRPG
jgi:uncharacterized alkaline shock family protein YloU